MIDNIRYILDWAQNTFDGDYQILTDAFEELAKVEKKVVPTKPQIKYRKQYYKDHREKILKRNKKYQKENLPAFREYKRNCKMKKDLKRG